MINKISIAIAIGLVGLSLYELITKQCIVSLICVFLQLMTNKRVSDEYQSVQAMGVQSSRSDDHIADGTIWNHSDVDYYCVHPRNQRVE